MNHAANSDKSPIVLRDATSTDWPAIVAMNGAVSELTNTMDEAQLTGLDRLASHHRVAEVEGVVAGFVLVMREGCGYDSENLRWFEARYPQFLYVDRIVVGKSHGGRGVGSALYDDVFAAARKQGIPRVVCEVNLEPPNEVSLKFHASFGFQAVGERRDEARQKTLAMQMAEVPED